MPGGNIPPSASQRSLNSRKSSNDPFSLELMQTDDVSTIAAQIANQAELIYQAWKTTDLHPSDLIRYHSVAPDRTSPLRSPITRVSSRSESPPGSVPQRIPIRNISPAPLGASPATPRKVIDIPIATEFPVQSYHSPISPKYPENEIHGNTVPFRNSSEPPANQLLVNVNNIDLPPQQHSPLSRTLNTSPRPYVPPSTSSDLQSFASHSSPITNTPDKLLSIRNIYPRPSTMLHSVPAPPERSSSYNEPQSLNHRDHASNTDIEASLRELVTNFVMEDKARLSNSKCNDSHLRSVAASSIQEALNRFEKQMAITSRVPNNLMSNEKYESASHSPYTYSSAAQTYPSVSKMTPNRDEVDGFTRRSISPGMKTNEFSDATSTWPLKNKQPSSRDLQSALNVDAKSKDIIRSQLSNSTYRPKTYVATLETRVDGPTKLSGATSRSNATLFTDLDARNKINNPLVNSAKGSLFSTDSSVLNDSSSSVSTPKKKYSISVSLDVDDKMNTSNTSVVNEPSYDRKLSTTHSSSLGSVKDCSNFPLNIGNKGHRLSTNQRNDDLKSFSSKITSTSDGRVLMAKSRFEGTGDFVSDDQWRSVSSFEIGSTLPEFYRRKLRKMRKIASPEPLHSLVSLPHPELTDQQKAHIRERSQSPTLPFGPSSALRPLTQGSVAERVLLFEKAPVELKRSSSTQDKRLASIALRDAEEYRIKSQDNYSSINSQNRSSHHEVHPRVSSQNCITPKLGSSVHDSENKENARPTLINSSLDAASTIATSSISRSSSVPLPLDYNNSVDIPSSGSGRNLTRRLPKSQHTVHIPRFYYPFGKPLAQSSQDQILERISQCFKDAGGQIQRDDMGALMRACQVPLYWKAPVFVAVAGEKLDHLTQELFVDYWARVISSCHDDASRFVRILSRGLRNFLLPDDFIFLVQDVVDTHPGLVFLKEATEFHWRYVHTVIARIYYCVNRSWSGKITIPELKKSNLLQVISYLEEEDDINKITDYFSYEHFYVIYCKFWELDTDHDLFVDRHDLAKHNDRALSDRIIDRVFSGAVSRGGKSQRLDRMGYQDFVWFLLSEEDKKHPTAIEYWFRCMDLDGDGYLSMYELEYFYEDQLMRMESLGIETLPFTDCLCQMLDMVRPSEPGRISLGDLKRCRMTPIFFDTFFNFDKYLDHEQRDPFASHRFEDEGPEMSDWDRYAAFEYELLVAEEGGAGAGDCQEDMYFGEEDELSMGVDRVLEGSECDAADYDDGSIGVDDEFSVGFGAGGGSSKKRDSDLSTSVNLSVAADPMDVDADQEFDDDYAGESDDYQ